MIPETRRWANYHIWRRSWIRKDKIGSRNKGTGMRLCFAYDKD